MTTFARLVAITASLSAAGLAQAPVLEHVGEALPDGFGQVITTADFDADGAPDLLSTTGAFLNRTGFFVPGPQLPGNFQPNVAVRALAAADFDGDGRADVLVARPSNGGSGLSLYQAGAGAVMFAETIVTLPGFGAFGTLAAADYDGDGDVDVIAASSDPGQPRWDLLINDGTGTFTLAPATQWPIGPLAVDWLGAGDFDGDGLLDICAASSGGPVWRRNLGGGVFSGSLTIAAAIAADAGVVGDFDDDGFDDLLLHAVNGAEALVPGATTGPTTATLGSGPALAVPAIVTDLNADGFDDVIRTQVPIRGIVEAELVIQRGASTGLGQATPLNEVYLAYATEVPFGPMLPYPGVVTLDVDGDGDLDTLVAPGNQIPWIQLNVGLLPPTRVPTGLPADLRTLMAPPRDIDGDGDLDLLRSFADNGTVRIEKHTNDGRGQFHTPATPAGVYPAVVPATATWGDVDGDGDDDLLVPGVFPVATNMVLLNDGTGQFQFAATLQGVGLATCYAIADFTGDGVVDIVVARSLVTGPGVNYQTPVLFPGIATQGGVSFAGPTAFGVAELITDMVVFDSDQDGDLDILCAVSAIIAGGGPSRIYENDGTGGMTALPQFAGTTADHVAVGDLDGDGLDDLVLGNTTWLRQAGNYVQQSTHPAPSSAIALADLDEDGDLDLIDRAGSWYPGDGTGSFAAPIAYVPYVLTNWTSGGGREPVDLDGDGDLDMIGPTNGAPGHLAIYSNLTRHIAPRTLATAGGTVTISVHGQPLDPWFLGVSLVSQGPIPLPPFGTLFLDPNAMVVFGPALLPPNGRFDLPVALPSAGSGFTLTWQALIGNPWRLTNSFDTPLAF